MVCVFWRWRLCFCDTCVRNARKKNMPCNRSDLSSLRVHLPDSQVDAYLVAGVARKCGGEERAAVRALLDEMQSLRSIIHSTTQKVIKMEQRYGKREAAWDANAGSGKRRRKG